MKKTAFFTASFCALFHILYGLSFYFLFSALKRNILPFLVSAMLLIFYFTAYFYGKLISERKKGYSTAFYSTNYLLFILEFLLIKILNNLFWYKTNEFLGYQEYLVLWIMISVAVTLTFAIEISYEAVKGSLSKNKE